MTQQQDDLDAIKSQIQEHLISSGNYDTINKQLKLQLYESGWFDKLSQLATTELQENPDKALNFEQLYSFLKPKAEDMVPDHVKEDILERLRAYLDDVIQ